MSPRRSPVAEIVQRYADGRISQGRAAELAGLTRAELINALSQHQVSPFQYTAEDLAEELREAD